MDNITIYNWISFLITPLTGVLSWWAARRIRNNSALQQMQDTINMLVDKNADLIDEVAILRQENIELKAGQQQMLEELQSLRAKEN